MLNHTLAHILLRTSLERAVEARRNSCRKSEERTKTLPPLQKRCPLILLVFEPCGWKRPRPNLA